MLFLAVFELGSLLCAVAPSSMALIIGRAVAGLGAAGLFSGGLIITAHTIPLEKRAVYMAVIMAMFSLANILGPVVGGALTQHVSWRWCRSSSFFHGSLEADHPQGFYINLPLGAVSLLILVLTFHPPPRASTKIPLKEKIDNLDLPGFVLFAPTVVMLLLALNWGGTVYPWKSAKIIGLICGAAGLAVIFVLWEWHQKDKACIPPSIFRNRTVCVSLAIGVMIFGGMQVVIYMTPIWFQVILGVSPTQSGINLFPTVGGNIIMSVVCGVLVSKIGYFNPFIFFGAGSITIAGGLYSTLHVGTTTAQWIGFGILTGAGFGAILQMVSFCLGNI